ncbi:MAG: phosphotransferase family protein, partial [Acidimicrobiales bacterium]
PAGTMDAIGTIRRIQGAITKDPLPPAPGHNDLLAKNIMDDGRIRLIDYDFSGMNDPCFDLGDLAMEGDYHADQLAHLCEAYFGDHQPRQVARAHLYGVAAQFTWTLLFAAMDQLLTEKPDESFDYFDEAKQRWNWTHARLDDALLSRMLEAAVAR